MNLYEKQQVSDNLAGFVKFLLVAVSTIFTITAVGCLIYAFLIK